MSGKRIALVQVLLVVVLALTLAAVCAGWKWKSATPTAGWTWDPDNGAAIYVE